MDLSGQTINRLIFTLSLLGLLVSAFLAFEYIQTGPIVCPITGTGCELVRRSGYANLFGIDLPYFGLVFYLMVAYLSVWLTHKNTRRVNLMRLVISFAGMGFGVYLTLLEAFVIGVYCIWCVTSFVISIIIFLLCLFSRFIQHDNQL